MDWARIDLHGAVHISRVCGVYEITDVLRVPDGKYKIKVLERGKNDFLALPNLCVKSIGGTPEWTSGLGNTEAEALEDALEMLGRDLDALKGSLQRERFEWSDPTVF
jgi:hypothetical protein